MIGDYAGEPGFKVEPLNLISRRPDGSGIAEISLSLHRTLASWFPTKWIDLHGESVVREVDKLLSAGSPIVLCELPRKQPKLWKALLETTSASNSAIKAFYTWDSSEFPKSHLELLTQMTEVFVPSQHLCAQLRDRGIRATHLPLALDLRPFMSLASRRVPRKSTDRFQVLSISAFHPRKNHASTIRAVVELMDEGTNIGLQIHSNLNQGSFRELQELIPRKYASRIQVTHEHLSLRDLQALLLRSDLLVSASGGETFNIGARQALASGMQIAVTDIGGHADLVDLAGVTRIPSEIVLPARYPEEDNQTHGLQHYPTTEAVKSALLKAMSAPKINSGEVSAQSRRWDYRVQKFAYRDAIFRSQGVNQSSSRSQRIQTEVRLVGHDGGFFSLFNTFVSIKRFWEHEGAFVRVIPDWSVESIKQFWNIDNFESFCYARPEDGNVFFKLFDVVDEPISENVHGLDYDCRSRVRMHSFNAFADPFLTFTNADRLYRSIGFQSWRNDMHRLVSKIPPNRAVRARVESVFSDLSSDAFVVGMHVRHPSHAIEQPGQSIPLSEDFIRVCEKRIEIEQQRNPGRDCRVFLATDQEAVTKAFRRAFGDALLMLPNVQRVSEQDDEFFKQASAGEMLKQGHQVQHLAAADKNRWSMELAEEVMADAWGLSRAEEFFHTVSNVATAVAMINPKVRMLSLRKGDTFEVATMRSQMRESTAVL